MWNDGKSLFRRPKIQRPDQGRRAPLVGRISLCNIVADVSGIECSAGDAVILPVNPLFVDSAVEREYV
jgi:alanine racemase